jgi:hypothetical protein
MLNALPMPVAQDPNKSSPAGASQSIVSTHLHGGGSCELCCPANAFMHCAFKAAARTWWLLPQEQQCLALIPGQSSLRRAAGTQAPACTADSSRTAADSTRQVLAGSWEMPKAAHSTACNMCVNIDETDRQSVL